MKKINLQEIEIENTEKRKEYFHIPLTQLIDGSQIFLPCAVIGYGDGPIVTVVSGQHGNEWTGTFACHLLFERLKPEDFNGKLVMFPIANPLAFRQKQRSSNIDFVDMNRVYRFLKSNKPTHQIAKEIFNNFCLKSKIVVDLHGGGPGEYLPIAEVERQDEIDLGLSLNLGRVITIKKDQGTIVSSCERNGVRSVSIEAGTELSIDDDNAEIIAKGIANLLKAYKVIKDKAETIANQRVFKEKRIVVSSKTGFFTSIASIGQDIKKGQIIGQVQPFFEPDKFMVKTPIDGNLVYLRRQRIISEGESVAHVIR